MTVTVKLKKCKKATPIHSVEAWWKHQGDLIILTKIRDGHATITYKIDDIEEIE